MAEELLAYCTYIRTFAPVHCLGSKGNKTWVAIQNCGIPADRQFPPSNIGEHIFTVNISFAPTPLKIYNPMTGCHLHRKRFSGESLWNIEQPVACRNYVIITLQACGIHQPSVLSFNKVVSSSKQKGKA